MSLLYADSSALVRAYFPDEADHDELRELLLKGDEPVVTSEIARLELASAMRAASSTRRVGRPREMLARVDSAFAEDGPIQAIDLRSGVILPAAHRLILEHRLRTLEAIHLAVCIEECPALAAGDDVVFVTRDADQGKVARSLGLAVR